MSKEVDYADRMQISLKTTQGCITNEYPNNTKAALSPMQIITCTLHVALVQDVPKGAFGRADGVLCASCRKRASSCVYPLSNMRASLICKTVSLLCSRDVSLLITHDLISVLDSKIITDFKIDFDSV